jgi:acyl-CoA synthetase (AMP-forming)/AMP-acid ligase II
MTAPPIPQVTLDQYEQYRDLHTIHSAVDYWAARKPEEAAIVNATRGTVLPWRRLQAGSMALANELWHRGFRAGDYLAASLPLLDEHILLEYACFRLGVIHVPLDLRLPPAEAIRCLGLVRAKGFFFLGKTAAADFAALGEAVRQKCGFVEHLVQFSPPADCIAGAGSFADWIRAAADRPAARYPGPTEHDGAQVIFTTGSTGSPKPALLSHRGITCQNLCLGTAFAFGPGQRVLCNLPASHVGGQAEILITSLFTGATAVTLEVFDAVKSLEAIERHGVTLLGQIPAMFNLEWRTADYGQRNFASLRSAVYGAGHRHGSGTDGGLGLLHLHGAHARCRRSGARYRMGHAGLPAVDPRIHGRRGIGRRGVVRRPGGAHLFCGSAKFPGLCQRP